MSFNFNIAVCLLAAVVTLGCQREQPITRHEIPKDRSGLAQLRGRQSTTDDLTAESPVKKEDDRMVVAMALRDDATWFFKLNAPVSRVNETEKQWRPFLKAIEFDQSGKPKWQLPEGWKVAGPKPMRFATLVVSDADPAVEIAVSSLSAGQDVLLNVNRWLGQLGLEPTTKDKLDDQLKTIQAGDEKLIVFDATGTMSGGMMPPFARAGAMPLEESANRATTSIEFTAPDGWTRGKPSPFLKARFGKSDGERNVQITVSSLPAATNKWLPNVKRWAGQVGMDSLDDSKIEKLTQAVTVDGKEGKLVRLIPEESKETIATIAVMVKKNANAWFFKLAGDRELVAENDKVLIEFLKTVKLP